LRPSVGLAGCGNWGKNILRDLLSLGCLVRVADPDPEARSRAISGGASATCAEPDQLPECDGYVVAVPIPLLAPVSAGLLPRGRPVFAEKTLCLSLASADRLAELGGDRLLFAMHKWRYHPAIDALRAVGAAGDLGELEELRLDRHAWVGDFHGGDVFWTQAVHDLTITRHVLGRLPEVAAAWARTEAGLPVGLLGVLEDRVRVIVSTTARHPVARSSASLHGSLGSAAMADPYARSVVVRRPGGVREIAVDTTFPLLLELREFVEHLRGGPPPRCPLSEAREMTTALLALRRAAGIGSGS
jgi:predicted dehydrogenase